MPEEFRYVYIRIAQGVSISEPIVAKLIYEGEEPFAQLPPDRAASLPEKIRLYRQHLELVEPPSAGRPARYIHKTPLLVP
jgi:hypothetical protein